MDRNKEFRPFSQREKDATIYMSIHHSKGENYYYMTTINYSNYYYMTMGSDENLSIIHGFTCSTNNTFQNPCNNI